MQPDWHTSLILPPPPDFFNNRWIDVIGHSDSQTDSVSANQTVSDDRASNVRDFLISLGVPADIDVDSDFSAIRNLARQTIDQSVDRFSDVTGVSDTECTSSGSNPSCRKAEIFMSSFPAGAGQPVPGTPGPAPTNPPFPPMLTPGAAFQSYWWGDACDRLLIDTAW